MLFHFLVQFYYPNAAGVSTAVADLDVIWNTPNNVNYTIEEPLGGVKGM